LLIPYLNEFKKLNPGAEVDYKVLHGKFEGLFICPHFMNHSLQFVRPVMSIDATHLKSKSKVTMYLAMVKTGLNEIYTAAISIERANKGYDGWHYFLQHLNIACPLIATNHPLEAHKRLAISPLFQIEIRYWSKL
jgi:hypothetical protein